MITKETKKMALILAICIFFLPFDLAANAEMVDKHTVFSVVIPTVVNFQINLLEGTDEGWVSSPKYQISNRGTDAVYIELKSIWYSYANEEDFVSVISGEAVKAITNKKAYFMQIVCENTLNGNQTYTIIDRVINKKPVVFYLQPDDSGYFYFTGAANPLSEIKWKDKDVTVYICYSIYNNNNSVEKIITNQQEETEITTVTENTNNTSLFGEYKNAGKEVKPLIKTPTYRDDLISKSAINTLFCLQPVPVVIGSTTSDTSVIEATTETTTIKETKKRIVSDSLTSSSAIKINNISSSKNDEVISCTTIVDEVLSDEAISDETISSSAIKSRQSKHKTNTKKDKTNEVLFKEDSPKPEWRNRKTQ